MPACECTMTQIGKVLMLIGILVVVVGASLWTLGRLGFKGLPGDVRYEGQGTRIYFPIVTCVVLSVILTLMLWLWQWISRRG